MNFHNRVCQKLHEEHAAVIALMERLGQTIARHRDSAADAKDPMVAKLLSDLAAELPGEVERHFAFEEAELFSYLGEAGNQGIGAHLTYEHGIIRPIGAALVKLIGDVRAHGFDAARWAEFRRLGQELNDCLVPHARKEDMALLPLLTYQLLIVPDGDLAPQVVSVTPEWLSTNPISLTPGIAIDGVERVGVLAVKRAHAPGGGLLRPRPPRRPGRRAPPCERRRPRPAGPAVAARRTAPPPGRPE